MNMEFFKLINNLAYKNAALDSIMIFFSKYVPYIFMAVIAAVFIIGIIKKDSDFRFAAVNIFTITVINLGLNFAIGNIYYVDRPFVHNKVNLLSPHKADASFPSDHAAGTMSIALGMERYNKTLCIILTTLSVIVGFSRVYVGHHYPMDVIIAYVIAFAGKYIYNLILRDRIEKLYDKAQKNIAAVFGIKSLLS